MLKKYILIPSIFAVAIVITIVSCGRKGTLHPDNAPVIEISEYSGIMKPDSVDSDSAMFEQIGTLINPDLYDSLFYQEIFWRAWDIDGTIDGYAYRIGTWDSTSNEWHYDRAFGIEVSDDGWVLHEQPNGEMGIWTLPEVVSARVYFPSTDTTNFRNNFGKFEVKCKDNHGNISNTHTKNFLTYSVIPTTFISSSQGNIDSCSVGTAISFKFYVRDDDPFGHGSEAAYYKYRFAYVERIGAREDTVGKGDLHRKFSFGTEILSVTPWDSTKGFETPDEIFLSLEANDIDELTQIQVKAIDKAGIEDPDYATMTFFVRDYFKPETRPFMSSWTLGEDVSLNIMPHIYVLGEHTYLTYLAEVEEIPSTIVDGEVHFADQFYMDKNEKLSAIWSEDIKIYLKWEYYGEYEYVTQSREFMGNTYFYDENLDEYRKYYCDIEYMDIQLDGGTDGLPPVGEVITDSNTDEEWIRIPAYEDQNCTLFDIAAGDHTFKVRAVDYQGAVDPTPESLEFTLHERLESDKKSGILVIDDTEGLLSQAIIHFCDEDSVDMFYEDLLEDYSEVETFDLLEENLEEIRAKNLVLRNAEEQDPAPYFAPSDIQNYKFILWHANNPNTSFSQYTSGVHMVQHYDLLKFYLNSGGNLLFTGCTNIADPDDAPIDFLVEYAGFSENSSTMNKTISWDDPLSDEAIFVGAQGIGNFSEIDTLNLNLHLYFVEHNLGDYNFPDSLFFLPPHIGPLGAIRGITYFDLGQGEPIFNCIPKSSIENPENYHGCIGSKYTKEEGVTGTTYILGFPLYYIELDDAKMFINKVFDEGE